MNIFEVVVLAIIEGITEFLPVSSTGHMIIASSLMGIQSDAFVKLFTVAIQLGTILSVVVLYLKRFFRSFEFYFKLFVAFIPAVIFGLLFSKKIDQLLESPLTVAVSLLLGGIILLFVDNWFKNADVDDADKISYPTALKVGIFQCLAMIPGVSRSGASIVGGMSQKLTRKAAAEFSFFLAVPTMFAATAKKLFDFYKDGHTISGHEINLLLIGNAIGFVVALIAIKSFIGFLSKNGFKVFGIYRIIVGAIIIVLILSGHSLQVI
ncbi:MAG: undecaprenyl-diphosphate phosphatase [Bacteroidetes bacterium]|nr:undecaprenyl-diphosphate phosphatase [Bacteroidota bacterium]MBU1373789.1 undecaprenyl-diphosphate phosphatase [Bacteroidota bacterium]MBU1483836.1 undecaprenyl-diphosphate phosphatase [Bacteroidota bacterium]MBU1760268.1 undecaprenyl-diphosphate phosphatase [Bacteroidota bacterium]MBU2046479.1 undecaprenyl-diphosphate phosphatase [Bacteroidota bacterium]